ncbi:MAG TPA: ribonuclease P protein component [Candidatus Portnoybacteria bacterium]|nr:ribonuclease P protein component [Candidatus Portnoybacteria bacterium]
MLSKDNRLNKQKDFDGIFKQGQAKQDDFLVVKAKPNQQNISRFGLIVSSRVSKKAVVRNLIRRRLSEIIRLNLDKIKTGADIVLVAKPGSSKAEYKDLEKRILNLLKKLNLYV